MKKAVIAVLALAVAGAGGYGVYHHFFSDRAGAGERVSSTSEDAVYVDSVAQITGLGSGNGLIERYGGEIEPQATLEVKLESERTVKECFVKEGDTVAEGQELFVYDTREDEDKLAQAQIEIERAEGDIELSEESINQLEKERSSASSDEQLTITTQILTEQNNIKRSEYEIESNKLTISQLEETIENATVTAEMAGIVQKISDPNDSSDMSYYDSGSGSGSTYITILAEGNYRVKGTLNEQNYSQVSVGMPMIIHSRVDETLTWTGEVTDINDSADEESADSMMYYGSDGSGSSNYTFYVELASSDGLMLGQHVYMEPDVGQNDQKDGLWLEDYYIIQDDDGDYVWLANESNVIEKRQVTLGEYDEDLFKFEILDGLTAEDYIAYPLDTISEGDPVIYNDSSSLGGDMTVPEGMDLSGDGLGDVLSDEIDGLSLDEDEVYMEDEYSDDEVYVEDADMYSDEVYVEDADMYGDEVYMEDEYSDGEVYVEDEGDLYIEEDAAMMAED